MIAEVERPVREWGVAEDRDLKVTTAAAWRRSTIGRASEVQAHEMVEMLDGPTGEAVRQAMRSLDGPMERRLRDVMGQLDGPMAAKVQEAQRQIEGTDRALHAQALLQMGLNALENSPQMDQLRKLTSELHAQEEMRMRTAGLSAELMRDRTADATEEAAEHLAELVALTSDRLDSVATALAHLAQGAVEAEAARVEDNRIARKRYATMIVLTIIMIVLAIVAAAAAVMAVA